MQEKWLEELDVLTEIAKSEPQAANAAFTAGFRHKITYYMRTIPNLQDVLKPLDRSITEKCEWAVWVYPFLLSLVLENILTP